MSTAERTARQPKVLLAEGTHDQDFFKAFLHNLSKIGQLDVTDLQVIEYGGKTCLREYLVNDLAKQHLVTTGALHRVAITRDADETVFDPQGCVSDAPQEARSAFESVVAATKEAGWEAPPDMGVFGTGNPKVGVFILPNNRDPGALETLCMRSICTYPEIPCLDAFFACAKQAGKTPGNEAKSRVQAWLSLQKQPDLHLGRAAQKGLWPFGDPAFAEVIAFLRELAAH